MIGAGAINKGRLDTLSWRLRIISSFVVVVVANAVSSGTVTVSRVS